MLSSRTYDNSYYEISILSHERYYQSDSYLKGTYYTLIKQLIFSRALGIILCKDIKGHFKEKTKRMLVVNSGITMYIFLFKYILKYYGYNLTFSMVAIETSNRYPINKKI